VVDAEPVAYEELGTEALVRMTLEAFPAYVAIDTAGNDLYADAPADWRANGGRVS
jgi:tartrate dehydratase beta subunit/fumarate hydratase class I family protein